MIEKQSKKINLTHAKKPTAGIGSGKRGGARQGAGRPPGAVSPEKKALRELAQEHTERAIKTLSEIMIDASQPGAVRVQASCALLDRGHGRPTQSVEIDQQAHGTVDQAALIALSEAMERSREQRRAIMERRKQMGFTGD